MAEKNRGISPDLLIHPGETISDLLEARNIAQKELAQRAGVSEAFLSDVIHGKKDISKGLAMGLEYALGLPRSFWLNLQANYDAELLSLQEEDSIQEEEKAVLTSIHEVIDYLKKRSFISDKLTQEQMIIGLRKLFQVSRLTGLRTLAPSGAFRMSDKAAINQDVLGAWLCLCKIQGSGQQVDTSFDPDRADELVSAIKRIMLANRGDLQKVLKELFAKYGIDFSIVRNFRGAPVHGYIARNEDGTYQMVLTLRGAFADIFWFSLFHELGHIINGDISKPGSFIDTDCIKDEKKEAAADDFASRSLLDQASYERFLDQGIFSISAIKEYAQTQSVPLYVVIGRLQKEEVIPWTWYHRYKTRYKWAES